MRAADPVHNVELRRNSQGHDSVVFAFPYRADIVDAVRTIPGRRFDWELLPGIADVRAVPERAATIVAAIAASPPIAGWELTASVGAALFPAHGRSLESLLRAADRAMYAAKLQGVPHHLAEGYAPRR